MLLTIVNTAAKYNWSASSSTVDSNNGGCVIDIIVQGSIEIVDAKSEVVAVILRH